jgi:hypothetical protein
MLLLACWSILAGLEGSLYIFFAASIPGTIAMASVSHETGQLAVVSLASKHPHESRLQEINKDEGSDIRDMSLSMQTLLSEFVGAQQLNWELQGWRYRIRALEHGTKGPMPPNEECISTG